MARGPYEIKRDLGTLRDGDVVFAAFLCDLDSCLGPAVRTIWCTPEHFEACANKQRASPHRTVVDVLNNDVANRIAQRALAAHMLDAKLVDSVRDEDVSQPSQSLTAGSIQRRYLLKTYLIPLHSEFEPSRNVIDMLFKETDAVCGGADDEANREHLAICVFVFPARDNCELRGLVVFFDANQHLARESSLECDLHAPESVADTPNSIRRGRTCCGPWLRRTAQLFRACFELKLRTFVRAASAADCVPAVCSFLSGACAVYAQCSRDVQVPDSEKTRRTTECHCSFVSCLLSTLTTCDRSFAEAAISAHLASRRSVVISANFDAALTMLRVLDFVATSITAIGADAGGQKNAVDADVISALNGGVWRNELTRKGGRGLLSGLPDGAALIGLQGVVPADGDVDSSQFVASEISVDSEFLFAQDRPLALIFVHVDRLSSGCRLTGSVYRVRELPIGFRRHRDAFFNLPTGNSAANAVPHRCTLRALYVSPALKRLVEDQYWKKEAKFSTAFPFHPPSSFAESQSQDVQIEAERPNQSSVLVASLLSNLAMVSDRVNPHTPSARACVNECLDSFWADVRCRAMALRRLFNKRSLLTRDINTNVNDSRQAASRLALQSVLGNLVDVRSEIDFHILCVHLLIDDPHVFG